MSNAPLASEGTCSHMPTAPWHQQAHAVMPIAFLSLCRQLHSHTQHPTLLISGICTSMPIDSLHTADTCTHLHTALFCDLQVAILPCPHCTLCSLHVPALTCPLPFSGLSMDLNHMPTASLSASAGTCTDMPTAPTCLLQAPALTCPLLSSHQQNLHACTLTLASA